MNLFFEPIIYFLWILLPIYFSKLPTLYQLNSKFHYNRKIWLWRHGFYLSHCEAQMSAWRSFYTAAVRIENFTQYHWIVLLFRAKFRKSRSATLHLLYFCFIASAKLIFIGEFDIKLFINHVRRRLRRWKFLTIFLNGFQSYLKPRQS